MNASNQSEQHDDIPAGFYRAQGVAGSGQLGFSENGTEQVGIDLHLIDLNRNVTTILYFSEKAAPFSLDRLRALGWKGGTWFDGIDANEVQVQIKYDVYQDKGTGQPKRSMKAEIQTGGGRLTFSKPMDDTQKRDFFARINAGAPAPAKNGNAPTGGNAFPFGANQQPAAQAKPQVKF